MMIESTLLDCDLLDDKHNFHLYALISPESKYRRGFGSIHFPVMNDLTYSIYYFLVQLLFSPFKMVFCLFS